MNHTVISLKHISLFCLIGLQSACQILLPSESSMKPVTLLTGGTFAPMSQVGVETDRGLLLNLDAVFFDVDRSTLRSQGKVKLQEFVKVIEQSPSRMVYIEGHTDSIGDTDYNQKLSERRANSVREVFIAQGIDAGRLLAKGYGETRPIAKNSSSEGRQKNRRVEVLISKDLVNPTQSVQVSKNCLYHPPLHWRGCDSPQAEK